VGEGGPAQSPFLQSPFLQSPFLQSPSLQSLFLQSRFLQFSDSLWAPTDYLLAQLAN